jgi:siroheme synthase (precorrin-2 oxidase/ferrochelatase)
MGARSRDRMQTTSLDSPARGAGLSLLSRLFSAAWLEWPRQWHARNEIRRQCRKCRIPVNTIATPALSAAAITSASRTDPPG